MGNVYNRVVGDVDMLKIFKIFKEWRKHIKRFILYDRDVTLRSSRVY